MSDLKSSPYLIICRRRMNISDVPNGDVGIVFRSRILLAELSYSALKYVKE